MVRGPMSAPFPGRRCRRLCYGCLYRETGEGIPGMMHKRGLIHQRPLIPVDIMRDGFE
jgi:hypothetical protein